MNALELHRSMEPGTLAMSFKGHMTRELIDTILSLMENRLEEMEHNPSTRTRVFSVMVECLQNLTLHADTAPVMKDQEGLATDRSSILFSIESNAATYRILTANYLRKSKARVLEKWLAQLASLDMDQLKELYKTIIRQNLSESSRGAGLGFVEIARKSGRSFVYEFTEIDKTFSFFCLEITISKG